MKHSARQDSSSTHDAARRALCLGSIGLLGAFSAARAADFPSKPVKIITAFPAGSGPDAALRVVAEPLAKVWGQPVVVENRPGGNGFIAIDAFRRAQPDGHELIQLDNTHLTTHPHLFAKLPYDAQKDLEPVRTLFRTFHFIVVGADSPYKSLADLIAVAKDAPGKLTYGSPFNGSPAHLGALMLEAGQGIKMVHVPFKETSQLYAAVATREVEWALGTAATAGAMEKAGRVRFIALAGPRRHPAYPLVQSTAETPALAGYEIAAWTGLFAPRGTPAPLRERLSSDVARALATAEVTERYRAVGYELFDLNPQAMAQMIADDTRKWGDVIRRTGLRLE